MNRSDNPICSVCIANYNGADVIGPCIESIYNQDTDVSIEIIIHDDASTDGSADIIKKSFPDVKVIRSDRNIGFCSSNNRMAQEARGEYLLLLNNDTTLHTDAIRTLYSYTLSQKNPGILSLPQYNIQTGELIDMGEMLDIFMNPVPNRNTGKQNVAMVIGACLWIPKKLWNELNGFPEWFGNLAEDMYLCCVARLKGHSVNTLSCSGYNHWVGKSFGGGKLEKDTMKTTYRRRALSERNKSYVMFLYYPFPLLYVVFPVHILILLFEGILLSVIKREMKILKEIYLSCIKSLWYERKRLLQLRCSIQKERCISLQKLISLHTFIPYKLSMALRYGMPTIE